MMAGRVTTFRELALPSVGFTPRHFREIVAAVWKNRTELPYARKILSHGVCDGCSIGSRGLRDPLEGLHLCSARLGLLRQHTIGPAALTSLGDVERLRDSDPERLRSLGRLAYPMIRRKGQRGFLRVSWDEAIDAIAQEVRRATPNELTFLATTQGRTNEVYYVYQKLARALGTNNIDLCSSSHISGGGAELKACLGFDASTCSLSDMVGTDLLVSFGCDQPQIDQVLNGYFRRAERAGTRVLAVHSSAGGARASGTLEHGDALRLRPGGDSAFFAGVLKFLLVTERVSVPFIDRHTARFAELAAKIATLSWDELEQRSGVLRETMQRIAEFYSRARSAVFLCGEGIAANHMQAIINLALARGMIGKEKCGILLVRADSGEQGALECGVVPDVFPGGYALKDEFTRRFSNLWHHPVSSQSGLGASGMISAAKEGRVKVLYALGCSPFERATMPPFAEAALSRVRMRVHQDTVLNASMLIEPADTVVLLPGQTRYEQFTGGISTSTERSVRFTPEIPGHPIGEARPDWEIPLLIGRRAMSNGDKLFPFADTQAIRDEMSRVMPIYQGVDQLMQEGDELQWGGAQLYKQGFGNMPQGRALFTTPDID